MNKEIWLTIVIIIVIVIVIVIIYSYNKSCKECKTMADYNDLNSRSSMSDTNSNISNSSKISDINNESVLIQRHNGDYSMPQAENDSCKAHFIKVNPDKTKKLDSLTYTFTQIANAYGVGNVAGVQGNTLAGEGAVIAIIDAYTSPTIVADLKTALTSNHGILNGRTNATTLANTIAGNLNIVTLNSSGLPTTIANPNVGWGVEEALDVQTIMSLCPGAKVYLIQAHSSSTTDLVNAISYAVKPINNGGLGVQVVSMSWGGGFPCSKVGTCLADQIFADYPDVVFMASAGDSAASVGWPMANPCVISVGGTYMASISNETCVQYPWADSGGGQTNYYPAPSYQKCANNTKRLTPDVGFLADPYSGVNIVDTYGNHSGIYGGTSLSCPIFASIIGLANSIRIKNNKAPLTQEQVWSTIYGPNNISYTFEGINKPVSSYFQTIGNTTNKSLQIGSDGNTPYPGNYDLITGMGSTNANFYNTLLSL